MKITGDLFRFDELLAGASWGTQAGVDEAGRGPLAGPVVAAAVILRRSASLPGLNDSKKLSPRFREALFRQIVLQARVGIGRVSESLVDRMNILEATRLAMRRAVLALPQTPSLLLIDGKIKLNLPLPQIGVVRGDSLSASIAAASIVAKVFRDHWMKWLDPLYPEYGFFRHKGYPTQEHLRLLRLKGPAPIHRKSFRPVREALRERDFGAECRE